MPKKRAKAKRIDPAPPGLPAPADMTSRPRRFTARQKAWAVRRHLAGKIPAAIICSELDVTPGLFYDWLRIALDGLEAAFDPELASRALQTRDARIASLQEELARKNAIIEVLTRRD